jgi:hypothetical protein
VARAQAGNTEAQIDLAFGYMSVGVELEMLGELDEAVATYQKRSCRPREARCA